MIDSTVVTLFILAAIGLGVQGLTGVVRSVRRYPVWAFALMTLVAITSLSSYQEGELMCPKHSLSI
jgi:hypothetical protein